MDLVMIKVRGKAKLLGKAKTKAQIKVQAKTKLPLKVRRQIKIKGQIKADILHQAKRTLRRKVKRLNQNLRCQVSVCKRL